MSETRERVSVDIDNELASMPSPFKPSIFRIPDYLKSENKNLHVPKFVSIGPIYHAKGHLQKMQQHKLRYLNLLLKRLNESSVDKYVKAIKTLEEQAYKCYADPIEFSSDDFVKMLLLDGCFIVELIRKYRFPGLRENDDPIFEATHNLRHLIHDMMLLENQVPFFILDRLFSMTSNIDNLPDNDPISLIQLIVGEKYQPFDSLLASKQVVPFDSLLASKQVVSKDPNHMLELMYDTWHPSFDRMTASKGHRALLSIHSAAELQEAGIDFEKDRRRKLLDITFVNGVLKIPTFQVSDEMESIFRNLILYEQLSNAKRRYVQDYAFFFHCLINSSKDVKILRLRGILTNAPGDDDMVNQMFKRLGKEANLPEIFCYADVFEKVNEHCKRRKNKWMANLRHNYLNSPWAYISLIAAVVLLLLTLIQAVFSILSYLK